MQINFHSDNACGSFIVAASEAYLEGRRYHTLYKRQRPEDDEDNHENDQQEEEDLMSFSGKAGIKPALHESSLNH